MWKNTNKDHPYKPVPLETLTLLTVQYHKKKYRAGEDHTYEW